jgi:hypothetical protein
MRIYLFPLACMAVAVLSGCQLLDGFFGGGGGKPPDEHPPSEAVATWLNYLIPGGGGLLGLIRWGYIEVRKAQIEKAHAALIAAGKADADNDGEEDKPDEVKTP